MRNFHMFLLALSMGAPAWGAVGAVSGLEGAATRAPADGDAAPLSVGDDVELGDLIEVHPDGNLKLTLSDRSVMMLRGGTRMRIDEARFEGQDRKALSVTLFLGAVWSNVTKALSGSEARFEVVTERAVAGVRGTTFQVELVRSGADTWVDVEEGSVEVFERAPATPGGARQSKRVRAGQSLRVLRGELLLGKLRGLGDEFGRFVRAHRDDRRRELEQRRERLQKGERRQRMKEHRQRIRERLRRR